MQRQPLTHISLCECDRLKFSFLKDRHKWNFVLQEKDNSNLKENILCDDVTYCVLPYLYHNVACNFPSKCHAGDKLCLTFCV